MVSLWVATLDFAKAFDTIQHNAIWKSISKFGISEPYACILKKLYSNQRATVVTDKESDEFPIATGSKERDPLSSDVERKRDGYQIGRRPKILHLESEIR